MKWSNGQYCTWGPQWTKTQLFTAVLAHRMHSIYEQLLESVEFGPIWEPYLIIQSTRCKSSVEPSNVPNLRVTPNHRMSVCRIVQCCRRKHWSFNYSTRPNIFWRGFCETDGRTHWSEGQETRQLPRVQIKVTAPVLIQQISCLKSTVFSSY